MRTKQDFLTYDKTTFSLNKISGFLIRSNQVIFFVKISGQSGQDCEAWYCLSCQSADW